MSGSLPAADGRPSLVRRGVRKARSTARGLRPISVRQVSADSVRVTRWPGPARVHRLDDPDARCSVAGVVTISVSDPAALVRLAAAGLLYGDVRGMSVRVQVAPEWLSTGLQPPAMRMRTDSFGWRREGKGVTVDLRWSGLVEINRALRDVLATVLRSRTWPQTDGPVLALDRATWLDGASSWPQGRLTGAKVPERDADDRPLGPYQVADPVKEEHAPVLTSVANPLGRKLFGAATPYRLVEEGGDVVLRVGSGRSVARLDRAEGVEAGLLRSHFDKYAVATVSAPPSPASAPALRVLGACGMVFAAADPGVRAALGDLDLVCVSDVAEVDDLRGYGLSAAASRRMAITGDAALRRTRLNGGDLPLPDVSVVLSSMRAEYVGDCLRYLAEQTYPSIEVLVGLHGYEAPAETVERWREIARFPLRVVPFAADLPFGAVLGRLSRLADGDLLTKVDDDDHYGPHHVTDLVIAGHATGADVVAKGARFVHLPDREETIDRSWAATELFNVTPAGGTLLFSRGTLQAAGGWSHSSRHVDSDLLTRIRDLGGGVFRTHALEYVYERRTTGHTFATDVDRLLDQSQRSYPGLPDEIVRPA